MTLFGQKKQQNNNNKYAQFQRIAQHNWNGMESSNNEQQFAKSTFKYALTTLTVLLFELPWKVVTLTLEKETVMVLKLTTWFLA